MKPIRFCLIGCGMVAKLHAAALAEMEEGTLLGVADLDAHRAAAFAAEHHCHAFASPEAALACREVDAILLCVPSGAHTALAEACMRAGKHVLIEKPLSMCLADCDRLIAVAKECGVTAGVVSQHRFSDGVQKAKRLLDEGRLGTLLLASLEMPHCRDAAYYAASPWRGSRALDGGALMNQGIHGVDTMLYLAGHATEVYGHEGTLLHAIEAPDTVAATLTFASGAFGVVTCTTAAAQPRPRRLYLAGTKGSIILQDDLLAEYHVEGEAPTVASGGEERDLKDPSSIGHTGHAAQLRDFSAAISEHRAPAVTLEDGRRAVALVLGVYTSSESKSPTPLD